MSADHHTFWGQSAMAQVMTRHMKLFTTAVKAWAFALCLAALLAETAHAKPAWFWSQGRKITMEVVPELVILRSTQESAHGEATADLPWLTEHLSPAQLKTLRTMGLEPRSAQDALKTSETGSLGIPVKFDQEAAVGVLTQEFLVALIHQPNPAHIQQLEGLARDMALTIRLKPAPELGIQWLRGEAPSPEAALTASNIMRSLPGVRAAHPNFILPVESRGPRMTDPAADAGPSWAPLFHSQWNLRNVGQTGGTPGADIAIEQAWTVTRGSPDTLVALLDLGFDQSHHALSNAWFVHAGEIPANRRDDDGNGLVDDVSGWNYAVNGPNLIWGAASQHGTATAGIIAARAESRGTIGICPECKVLPVVVDNEVANAAAAFRYVATFNTPVISNSWGYPINVPTTDVVTDAIHDVATQGRQGRGVSIVFAMSNFGRNDCRASSPDISAHPDVIAVSTTDFHDQKIENSAWGPCLKIVAPSSGSPVHAIATTDRSGNAGYNNGSTRSNFPDPDFTNTFWGTSAAAPQVAATLALIYSINPNLSSNEAQDILIASTDKVHPTLAQYDAQTGHSLKWGFGRLNAARAVQRAASTVEPTINGGMSGEHH